jgi:hypothetical protein
MMTAAAEVPKKEKPPLKIVGLPYLLMWFCYIGGGAMIIGPLFGVGFQIDGQPVFALILLALGAIIENLIAIRKQVALIASSPTQGGEP